MEILLLLPAMAMAAFSFMAPVRQTGSPPDHYKWRENRLEVHNVQLLIQGEFLLINGLPTANQVLVFQEGQLIYPLEAEHQNGGQVRLTEGMEVKVLIFRNPKALILIPMELEKFNELEKQWTPDEYSLIEATVMSIKIHWLVARLGRRGVLGLSFLGLTLLIIAISVICLYSASPSAIHNDGPWVNVEVKPDEELKGNHLYFSALKNGTSVTDLIRQCVPAQNETFKLIDLFYSNRPFWETCHPQDGSGDG